MVNNLSINYLFSYAMAHNIQFEATHLLQSDTPSCYNTTNRKMVINLSNDEEGLPLEIAHEISRIFNGDKGKFYYCGDNSSSPIEVSAHKTDIKILANYYFEDIPKEEWNVDHFMYCYCIPPSYKDWTIQYLKSL